MAHPLPGIAIDWVTGRSSNMRASLMRRPYGDVSMHSQARVSPEKTHGGLETKSKKRPPGGDHGLGTKVSHEK